MLLKSTDVEDGLRDIVLKLEYLLSAVWTKEDSRLKPAGELLAEAVWQKNLFPFGEERFDIEAGELHGKTSNMQGRVLTAIEMFFPEGQQCKAIKQKALGNVWDFYFKMLEKDLNPKEIEEGPVVVE